MHVYSQLVSAQFELKASDYSAGTNGRVWFNTGSSLVKFDDGSAIRTFVTTDNTQTLTNKSLSDSTTYIVDDGDSTKKLQFQCSGITTGTTRTLTVPDANTTIVGTDTTQTLTNKTWNGSTIVTTYGGTGLSSYSAGDIPYYASGTALSKLTIGSSGKILQSNGTAPTWATPSASFSVTAMKTSNYTATSSDDLIPCDSSGGAFTITLPASTGTGKVWRIRKYTSDFTAITISRNATPGTDTIADQGATTSSTTIHSYGEEVAICDYGGGTFMVVERRIPSYWVGYSNSVGAVTTNPTKGTVSVDQPVYRREGDSLRVRWNYVQTAAGAAGTGSYLFLLPNSAVANTTTLNASTSALKGMCGSIHCSNASDGKSSSTQIGVAAMYDSTHFWFYFPSTSAGTLKDDMYAWGSTSNNTFGSTNLLIYYDLLVPISGWNG